MSEKTTDSATSTATPTRFIFRFRSTFPTARSVESSSTKRVAPIVFAFAFAFVFALSPLFARTSPVLDAPNESLRANSSNERAPASAPTARNANDDAVPAFRYWKAPFDAIDRWPWGDRKYYPIEKQTFDEWLRATSGASKGDSRDDVFSSFSLDAKFEGDALEGVARFSLALLRSANAETSETPDAPAEGDANEPLLLRPFSFGASDLREGFGPDAPPAYLGLYPDGRLCLANPKTGDYSFRWSQRGVVDPLGSVSFDLAFPASPQTEIRLETPFEASVSSSEGVVEAVIPQNALDAFQAFDANAATRSWRVFLGGKSKTRLTISRETPEFDVRRKVGYRLETSHRVSLEGVEVVSRFTFDRSDALPTEATLLLDAPLAPISVDWDGRKGAELDASQTNDGETTKIKIRRPERTDFASTGAGDGKSSELKVVAFRPLTLGVEERLPSVRLVSDGAVWKETLCRLVVVRPVVATSTKPIDAAFSRDPFRARQDSDRDFGATGGSGSGVGATNGTGSNDGSTTIKQDAFAFKFFEPNAGVSVKFQTPTPKPAFDSATDCSLVAGNASAKTTLFVQFERDFGSRLSVPIASDWEIDSVQTPADETIVWSFDKLDSDASNGEQGAKRVLSIAFQTQPPFDRPTRVVLLARRSKPIDQKIAVDKLCPIDLTDSLRGAHALALRAESPYRVKLTTLADRPFVPSNETPNFVFGEAQIREALPPSSGVDRLYFGDGSAEVVASLENAKSNYSARLSGVGSLRDRKFAESWRLRCVPAAGARVDRIVFFAFPNAERTVAAEGDWYWSTSNEPERRFVAERLSTAEIAAFRVPDSAVAFEIRLATSRSVPFELNIEKETPATREIQAPLLFLPEAAIETAEFTVESPFGEPFWTRVDGLDAISSPLASFDEYEPLKSAFQYAPTPPSDSAAVFKLPRLDVLLEPPTSESNSPILDVSVASAWCWFETLDSFFESDGSTRERVSFFIENRGRTTLAILVPKELDVSSAQAIWLDGERVSWAVDEERDSETNALIVALPSNKRFVSVAFEYSFVGTKIFWRGCLKPTSIGCDVPILSGSWSAWIPPEFDVCDKSVVRIDAGARRFLDAARGFVEAATSRRNAPARLEEVAERFLTRFGDADALRRTLSSAKSAPANENETSAAQAKNASTKPETERALASSDSPSFAPTWGDVFGAPAAVARLFAPFETPGQTRRPSARADADGSNFAPIPFSLYFDRFRCSRLAATPETKIAFATAPTPVPAPAPATPAAPRDLAARTLENAGFALVVVDSDLALMTTPDALSEIADSVATVPVCGSAVRRVDSRADAVRLRRLLVDANDSRFVDASVWRESVANGPWVEPPRDFAAPGWLRVSTTLAKARNGALVADRYALATLRWLCFVAFVALCWNRRFARPAFFVATIGISLAIRQISPIGVAAAFGGIALGALCSFAFYLVRYAAPNEIAELSLESLRRSNATRREKPNVAAPVRKTSARNERVEPLSTRSPETARTETEPRRRVQADRLPSQAEDDDESTQGFVDLERLRELGGFSNDERSNDRRRGTASFRALAALATVVFALVAPLLASIRADDAPKTTGDSTNDSASASAASPDSWREPYRVFVPVDESRETVGPYYWVSDEFYERIRETLKSRPREKNWRIVDALYEGAVNYNAFSGTTSLFNLKATYKVFLDSPNATIVLPATQLASDVGAKFDKQTISPIFDEAGKELRFEIEDAAPGEHRLELTLIPPQFSDADDRVSFPIPRVPTARLELVVPLDAPPFDVPNSLGKVARVSDRLVAELGAVDRLVLSKGAFGDAGVRAPLDVEQYFLLRTRSTQADVRARFVCQTGTEKIRSATIDCDPTYSFSGRCVCDQAEIESIDPPTAQNDSMRISFKKPVSGSFALEIDFVARNFSGVGTLRLPQISTARARVLKNWLALVPSDGVKCVKLPESTVSAAAFQTSFGTFDGAPLAAFDLATAPNGLSISTRLERPAPLVSETTTLIFRPSRVDASVVANFKTASETFRVDLDSPRPFAVDSVAAFSPDGTRLATPEYFLSDDGASLIFREPPKGDFSLKIAGRAKAPLEVARRFPTFELRNVEYAERALRVYRSPNVYLDGSTPSDWVPLESSRVEALETSNPPPEDARLVGVFELPAPTSANGSVDSNPKPISTPTPPSTASENAIVESTSALSERTGNEGSVEAPTAEPRSANASEAPVSPASTNTELDGASALPVGEIAVRVNSPKISGRQRVVSFRNTAGVWRAIVDFRLKIDGGRVERLCVAADDAYSLSPLDPESNFVVGETTTVDGERALVFEPKTPIRSTAELTFVATAQNGGTAIRLPRFRLLPASSREDVAGVVRFAFLPERVDAKPIRWETQDWRRLRRSSESASLDAGTLALEREAARRAGSNRTTTKSTAALASIGKSVGSSLERGSGDSPEAFAPLPPLVAHESGMQDDDFAIFEATSDAASASVASDASGLRVARAEHSFYLNSRRQIFGSSVFSIRSSSTSECVVVAPPDCVSFEATVDGSRRLAERLDERRWRVDLGGPRLGKRLEVSYRRSGGFEEPRRATFFGRRDATTTLDFPRVEGAKPDQTVWASAFDSTDDFGPRWRVYQRENVDDAENASAPSKSDGDAFAVRAPIPFFDATELLFRYGVGRALAEFDELESDAASVSNVRGAEFERELARWKRTWNQCEREIAQFEPTSDAFGALTSDQRAAVFAVESEPKNDSTAETLDERAGKPIRRSRSLDDADLSTTFDRWTLAQYRETLDKKSELEQKFRFDGENGNGIDASSSSDASNASLDRLPGTSPQSLWTFDRNLGARLLFGVTDRDPSRIELVVPAKRFDFFASPFAVAALLLAATLALVDLIRADLKATGFKRVVFGGLVVAFAIVFFVLGNRPIGLFGILALAVEPRLAALLTRRAARRNETDAPNDLERSSNAPETAEFESLDLESTAAAPPPIRASASGSSISVFLPESPLSDDAPSPPNRPTLE